MRGAPDGTFRAPKRELSAGSYLRRMDTTEADLTGANSAFAADPYPLFAELRERGPVHRARVLDGRSCWIITGYDEAKAAFTDPRLSNDMKYLKAWDSLGRAVVGKTMLQADPPDHTRLRKLVAREFTVRRMQSLQPRIEELAAELLDAMVPQGQADLVSSYALPLPLQVICELIGVPFADRAAFHKWSADLSAPATPEDGEAAQRGLTEYLAALIEDKRRTPCDDLIGALVNTTDENGDSLSSDELLGMSFLLLVGGHESTANLIASGTLALLRHPEQLAALRADWSLLDTAVEEVLRYDGPVEFAALRYTKEPIDIAGTVIGEGEVIMIGQSSSSRDPKRFPNPDSFDISRDLREARAHFGFGFGVHHCLGAPLARLEGAIGIRALLQRCPDLALAVDPAELTYCPPTFFMRGLKELPVRFQ
ncbi:cytochrome P450 [Lentzea flava]|uniref:Cytochrome P450 n=2 Tax=Lentzea flava TaxID=103732 RepID=A0ABQ2V7R0_9PSEU|nr:Cytochrome P450 [Lentzea flava]GGU72591.1 cytochrome P450 [Lentzea flava]